MTIVTAMLLAAVLPGGGLVYLGWVRTGMLAGVVFAASAATLLAAGLLWPGAAAGWLVWTLIVLAGAAWVASAGATAYVAARRVAARTASARDSLFREGLAAYLRADYEAAGGAFRSILRLCRSDVEAHLKLAMVYKALGRQREAAAELRRCRFYDARDTWRWEVERELATLTSGEGGG